MQLGWTTVRPRQVPGSDPKTRLESTVALESLTRIVRGKDVGDSYNFAPPADDVLVGEPTEQRLEMLEDGPLRRVCVLHRRYLWDDKPVDTQTRFEQRAGEPFVRIRIDFDNPCEDQRVRVHVLLREPTDGSSAPSLFYLSGESVGNSGATLVLKYQVPLR